MVRARRGWTREWKQPVNRSKTANKVFDFLVGNTKFVEKFNAKVTQDGRTPIYTPKPVGVHELRGDDVYQHRKPPGKVRDDIRNVSGEAQRAHGRALKGGKG